MIHPMWNGYAKIALRVQLSGESSGGLDDDEFKSLAATMASEAAEIADAMCAEYDKRNQPAASDAPSLSAETAVRAARIKSNDGPF